MFEFIRLLLDKKCLCETCKYVESVSNHSPCKTCVNDCNYEKEEGADNE